MSFKTRWTKWLAASLLAGTAMTHVFAIVVERALNADLKARISTFELPGQAVEMRSFVPNGRGGVFMVVGSRAEGESGISTRLLSLTGTLGDSADLRSRPLRAAGADSAGLGIADGSPLAGSLLAVDDQGSPYTVAVALNGGVQLTRFGDSGRAEQAFNVDLKARSVSIRRLSWLGKGQFLLAGAEGSRPLLATVDSAGKVGHRYAVVDEDAAAVAAGLMPDGKLAVLIEKGSVADPRFAVLVIGQTEGVVHRVELTGQPVDLAVGAKGQIFALVERRGVAARDLVALSFSSGLDAQVSRTLVSEIGPLARFRIVALAGGGAMVAGRKDRGLWLSRLSDPLAEVWTSWTDPRKSAELETTLDIDLARAGDAVFVGYSAMVVRDRRQYAVVRAMQFKAD